ncbi:hypothetical protein LQ948_17610 [Jiella sp. MQZ9-1]|uniref:Uncharacterized protein n=1 Tax=Jiella flava TaxID=2816857 RepID=A0A939G2K1_9HYPH|nr:hypothetical protein [Jiella flava]MBO0664393.1 hypothetical protein [Jiella flava]MCD2473028.1 hypothetical protein [Jiella flava]
MRQKSGRVLIGSERVDHLPANRRPTVMIFQSLALLPRISVGDNVAFERASPAPRRGAALAVEPAVLCLDEPLTDLDPTLRKHRRTELRALQKGTGVTFISIT